MLAVMIDRGGQIAHSRHGIKLGHVGHIIALHRFNEAFWGAAGYVDSNRFSKVVVSGLGLIVKLPDGVDDREIVHYARKQNLAPSALSTWHLRSELARNGLLFSITNLRPDNILSACAALDDVVSARI